MKRILIGTDFSSTAQHAIDYGVEVARRMEAKIILLNTFIPPHLWDGPSSHIYEHTVSAHKIEIENKLRALSEKIKSINYINSNDSIECDFVCHISDPVSQIVLMDEKGLFDFIIIGNTGSVKPNRYYSSTAVEIIGKTHVPIFIIPESAATQSFHNFLYCSEFLENELNSIKQTADIVNNFDAKLHVLHVNKSAQKSDDHLTALNQLFIQQGINNSKLHSDIHNSVISAIENCSEREHVDLIIVWKHQRNFLESLFHKSITEAEIKFSKIPLLVINP